MIEHVLLAFVPHAVPPESNAPILKEVSDPAFSHTLIVRFVPVAIACPIALELPAVTVICFAVFVPSGAVV